MSDLEFFYAVMAAFYLWECTHWLGSVTVPFISWAGAVSRVSQPFFVSNSREGGLHLASPLPVAGTFMVAAAWPFAVSPLGVANSLGRVVRFVDQPRFTSRRQQLRVNGQLLARTASSSHARALAEKLNQVVAAPEAEREARVSECLDASLDSASIVTRLGEFRKAAQGPGMMAAVLTVLVFLASPLVIWRWGLAMAWPWLLGTWVVVCVVNSIGFFRAHKRLYPELPDERFAHHLMVLLFPPAGMRSRDLLSRPLLEGFHPLAVARELCSPGHFEDLASRVVREFRYPRPRKSSVDGDTVWEWFNRRMLAGVERFVVRNKLSLDPLVAAPERADEGSRSYCPRCHAQFILAEGTCSDCGVALVRFQRPDA